MPAVPDTDSVVEPITLSAEMLPRHDEVLSSSALDFIIELHRRFDGQRKRLLRLREENQRKRDAGPLPDFAGDTAHIRDGDWSVAAPPPELRAPRVIVHGPVNRDVFANSVNSAADVVLADFHHATVQTWGHMIAGQIALKDRCAGKIEPVATDGKGVSSPAAVVVCPRGWERDEDHVYVDGVAVSATLFDFGLHVFHNARPMMTRNADICLCLPGMESHVEARLWNDVLAFTQENLRLTNTTIKAIVRLDALGAAFEMDEMLYELRAHAIGLHFAPVAYAASFIRAMRENPAFMLPDWTALATNAAFLKACRDAMIATCRRRGALAIGSHWPFGADAIDTNGVDGIVVSDPALIAAARAAFETNADGEDNWTAPVDGIDRKSLLGVPEGPVSEQGLRANIARAVHYMSSVLQGQGTVAVDHQRVDMAIADLCCVQVWQQVRHGAHLDDGRTLTRHMFLAVLDDELESLRATLGQADFIEGRYGDAARVFRDRVLDSHPLIVA